MSGRPVGGDAGDKVWSQVRDQTITWMDGHLARWASSERFIFLLGATNLYAKSCLSAHVSPLPIYHWPEASQKWMLAHFAY